MCILVIAIYGRPRIESPIDRVISQKKRKKKKEKKEYSVTMAVKSITDWQVMRV